MANDGKKYSWLITFLIYDNAWYDKDFKNDKNYISLEDQKLAIYKSIDKLDFNNQVKIVLVDARIDLKENYIEVKSIAKTELGFIEEPIELNVSVADILSNDYSLERILSPIKENNPADHNLIITIGHGSIFGINLYSEKLDMERISTEVSNPTVQKQLYELSPDQANQFEINKEVLKQLPQNIGHRFNISEKIEALEKASKNKYMEVYVPSLNLTVLTVKEISIAINQVFENPIDILVLDNCLMQNLYTQFELRDCVQYLVAAESGISYPGFNYVAAIEMIYNNEDPKNIANSFVKREIIENHIEYNRYKNDIENRWCLSTVHLTTPAYNLIKKQFDELFLCLNAIVAEPCVYRTKTEIFKLTLKAAKEVFGYNTYALQTIKVVDFNGWLYYFKQLVSANSILTTEKDKIIVCITKMQEALGVVTTESFIGEQFYPGNFSYVDKDNNIPLGFGFLMPPVKTKNKFIESLFTTDGNIEYTPSFLKNSGFISFMNKYRKWVPPGYS